MTTELKDRFRGVLLGMACGDALGAQVEFMPRDSFPLQVDMTGAGPHRLQPGQWTDDTAMALILGERLLVDALLTVPLELANDWLRWYELGEGSCTGKCFDIGSQTLTSLLYWERFGTRPLHKDQKARGNGGLMRVAPVALAWLRDRGLARNTARRQCLMTHPESCADLCAEFTNLLIAILQTPDLEPANCVEWLAKQYPQLAKRKRAKVSSGGYDLHTFEAAVWCVLHGGSLEGAVVLAANLGDDADTVGAVTGALAGAVWGAREIPSRWLKPLAWGDRICGLADRLYAVAH